MSRRSGRNSIASPRIVVAVLAVMAAPLAGVRIGTLRGVPTADISTKAKALEEKASVARAPETKASDRKVSDMKVLVARVSKMKVHVARVSEMRVSRATVSPARKGSLHRARAQCRSDLASLPVLAELSSPALAKSWFDKGGCQAARRAQISGVTAPSMAKVAPVT